MSSKGNIFTENNRGHSQPRRLSTGSGSSASERALEHFLQLQRSDSGGSDDSFGAEGKPEEKKRPSATEENSGDEGEDLNHELDQVLMSYSEEKEKEGGGGVSMERGVDVGMDGGVGDSGEDEQQQDFSMDDGNDTNEEHETDMNGRKDDTGSTESVFSNHMDEVVELQSLLIALNIVSKPGGCLDNAHLHSLVDKTTRSFAGLFQCVCDDHQNIVGQSSQSAREAAKEIVTKIKDEMGASAGARAGGRESVAQSDEVDYAADDANDEIALGRQENGSSVAEIEDEDRTPQLRLEDEEALMSSLLAKLRGQESGTRIIASQTNLLGVVELVVQNIFDPHNPKYQLLPQVANNVFKALMCNDKVNKALAMYHSGKAQIIEDDIIGLDNEVTWGEIALGVAKKISNEEERADLPEEIASLIADARVAVSQYEKKMSLENFVKVGLRTKVVLSSLVSLAIMRTVTSQLTLRMVFSDMKFSLEWRQDVEELHEAIHPEEDFSPDEKLSEFMTNVLRRGLSSSDKELLDLSCCVLRGILKHLNVSNVVTEDVRAVILDKFEAAQSITVDGSIDRSKADYCAGEGTIQARARSRMILQYMICFAHDILVRKLDGATTGKDILRMVLCTGQETIRKKIVQSIFDMSTTLPSEKKKAIKKLVAVIESESNETRSLLIDNEEQVKSMQNILKLARTEDDDNDDSSECGSGSNLNILMESSHGRKGIQKRCSNEVGDGQRKRPCSGASAPTASTRLQQSDSGCAAGAFCNAPPDYDLGQSTHKCMNCQKKMHCVLWCGASFVSVKSTINADLLSEAGKEMMTTTDETIGICQSCINSTKKG